MPAEIEQMMYFGQTPWHESGNKIDESYIYDIEKSIVASGLDWEVKLESLITVPAAQKTVNGVYFTPSNLDSSPVLIPNTKHRAVVRNTNNSVLGVVGPRYTPLQNRKAFEWFQPYLDAKECALHTAGSLYNGQKVWVLAQINKANSIIAKNDEVAKFILLSNSHDGTTSIRVGFTPIRVVCANTMAMAHSAHTSQLIRIRHSNQLHVNLEKIREVIDLANEKFEASAEQFRFLANKSINTKDLNQYIKTILQIDLKKDKTELPTRTQNKIADIAEKIISGKNQNLPSIRGTWWAAYNGVNEYLNYTQGRNENNRLHALWFGNNANVNQKALDTALSMAG